MAKLPEGDRPILNSGIARTRYLPMFRVRGEQELFQFDDLLDRVGLRLDLQPDAEPYIVPSLPLEGVYATGSTFQINRAALFTATSKMPGPSFALPAGPPDFGGTCPAAALGENKDNSMAILTEQVRANPPTKGSQRRVDDSAFTFAGGQSFKRLPVLQGPTEKKNPYSPGVEPSTYYPDSAFVCRSCYALNSNYNYPSKQVNDMLHLAWVKQELKTGGAQRLGHALAYAIQHVNLTRPEGFQPYFRIHDAGDFYTPEYLEAWVVCASLMTHMRFWAPTRQWVFAKWVPLLRSAEERVRAAGGWLTIRASVLRIGDPVPMLPGLSAGSGVSAEDPCAWVCPVYNKVVPRLQPDGSVEMVDAASCLEANCTMCVAGDTRVMVQGRGLVRIDELVDQEFTVWSGKAWRKTRAVFNGVRPTVELQLNNGATVRVTADHKILTGDGMIEADELDDADELHSELPSSPPFPSAAPTPRRDVYGGRLGDRFPRGRSRDVGVLLGWILGDGSITQHSAHPTVSINVGSRDRVDLERLRDIVMQWCSTDTNVVEYRRPSSELASPTQPMVGIQWRIKALAEFVEDLSLDKRPAPQDRRAPASIWSASADGVAGFIAGLFATDGAVSVNKQQKIELSLSSVSRGLLQDVQQLLFGLGVRAALWKYPPRTNEAHLQLHALSVWGVDNIRRFNEIVGIACERKQAQLSVALEAWAGRSGRTPQALRVVAKTPLNAEPVYDLVNVGDEHQFVANWISVSNCWDQPAIPVSYGAH